MRVANKIMFDAVRFNLANITEELIKTNEVVSTGKLINDLSDDPVGLTQTLNIRSTLSNIDQVGRNIARGTSWLAASEGALNQVQNIVSDIKALCVQMASANMGPTQRSSAAESVQNMLNEIISLANTDVTGTYIFSGSKTDTAPFDQSGTYSGDNNAFTIKIGKSSTVEMENDGAAVFGNIFTTFSDLKNALQNNDISGIQNAMDNLDGHFDDISNSISGVGSKMLRMEVKEKIYQDLSIANMYRLSKIEDADMAEAIMQLKSVEFAYQAALSSSAKIMTMTLVDFL